MCHPHGQQLLKVGRVKLKCASFIGLSILRVDAEVIYTIMYKFKCMQWFFVVPTETGE